VKRTLIDTLGCAVGGFEGEPSIIARRMAGRMTGPSRARVLGTREYTVPDQAAFTNTVLVRYLDCNDTYAARGTGHPSDMIPAVLAAAGKFVVGASAPGRGEAAGATGRDVITGVVLAYEVFCRLVDEVPLLGWDQGMFAAAGAACGAGKLMGLDRAAMRNAISLAMTWGIPLGVVRTGELSMWKGCATAAANRTAVYAAQLAAEGMTGPGRPFEGRDGLWQHLGVEPPAWGPFGGRGASFRILDTTFKAYPAVVHTQGPIGLVLQLREQVPAEEVESVRVWTYGEAIRRTAAEAEKWDPQTRETADHSIPFLVSAAWHDGAVTPATFIPARIQDPALRPFIKRLSAEEDPGFTRRYPAESCSRVEVTAAC
jgi:2-methylcitrate dehydratase